MKRRFAWMVVVGAVVLTGACSQQEPAESFPKEHDGEPKPRLLPPGDYPVAVDLDKVGTYPMMTKSGGGFFYDDVLEYRVWVHSGGDDTYRAFVTYEEAGRFFEQTERAELPLVLVLQREHVDEPEPGKYVHIKSERITEWRVEWLAGSKRGPDTISEFLQENAK